MPPVPKDEAERNKKVLAQILKLPHNKECADCTAKAPTWCPTNWGVFVCIRCAGIHRKMGTHISTVKSCTLDSWYDKEVELVKLVGNKLGKMLYEAGLNRPKPDELDDVRISEEFIRNKYEKKLWMRKGAQDGVFGVSKLLQQNPELADGATPEATPESPSPLTPQSDGPAAISYGRKPVQQEVKQPKPIVAKPSPRPSPRPSPMATVDASAPSLLEFEGSAQQTSVEALLVSSVQNPAPKASQVQSAPQPAIQAPQFDNYQKTSKDMILDAFQTPAAPQGMPVYPQRGMMPPRPMAPMQPPMPYGAPRPMYPSPYMPQPMPYGAPMRPMPPQQPMMMPPQPMYPMNQPIHRVQGYPK